MRAYVCGFVYANMKHGQMLDSCMNVCMHGSTPGRDRNNMSDIHREKEREREWSVCTILLPAGIVVTLQTYTGGRERERYHGPYARLLSRPGS